MAQASGKIRKGFIPGVDDDDLILQMHAGAIMLRRRRTRRGFRRGTMSAKTYVGAITIAVSMLGFTAQPSFAQGHIAGGAVGAVATGKHHRVAGAVVGGAIDHHMAKNRKKKQAAAAPK